jgi:superfamily II DNA or RNA helicase
MSTFSAGDRVFSRGRPWKVREAVHLGQGRISVELEALDSESPASLTLLSPPDAIEALASSDLELHARGFESFSGWSSAHRVLAAGLIRETGLLSGARFGRVALEAYQLAPVLRLLAKPRPSLLVADDVGLGKTIEAGLVLLELMARGRAKRVLVVAPPGLLDQWQQELRERFGLEFTVLDNAAGLAREQTNLPAGIHPWDALPRVLTSIDFLKRETVRRRALRKRWDLVIVDEAHALAESGTPSNPYRTQRFRLGQELRDNSRGLVLLTATPHNGYRHSFRSLLELIDPTLATFEGDRKDVERRIDQARVRRMKRQLKRRTADGREEPVFPERHVIGIPVPGLEEGDRELLAEVARYCSGTAKAARGTEVEDLVTFAMQIVKKRALSSRLALATTIRRRLEALQKEAAREAPPERSELRDLQAGLPQSEVTAERIAERVLRSAIPADEKRRKSEVRALKGIRKKLEALPARDPKLEAVLAEIRRVLAEDADEKLIVFTEYRDTLTALVERLDADPELRGRYVLLRGGLTRKQRGARQKTFEESGTRVLLATDAASEGLNLQRRCRRVLHVELPWNPNRLEQRNGRVDRYGQTREPEIRYFFYPDSPEERVLDQLVGKLEEMQKDRVSTPDVLGVWAGDGTLERELTELGAEGSDIGERMVQLIRDFDDRTAEFVRDVQPLVAAGGDEALEMWEILDLLGQAEPLAAGSAALERTVRESLGPNALLPGPEPGTFRIEVPPSLRGPGVRSVYPAATFDRGVAVRFKAEEVELVTPLHPLAEALRADARRRFLQVYPDRRGLVPRRLAVRRIVSGEPASTLFTFLVGLSGGGDLIEEHLLGVRVGTEGHFLGDPIENLRLLNCSDPGEVSPKTVLERFGAMFEASSEAARNEAAAWVHRRAAALRDHRHRQGGRLRSELETDLADRLREIGREESRARTATDAAGQQHLFESADPRVSFDVRRKAAQAQAEERIREIGAYEEIDEPAIPRLLGALFLVPEELP